MRILFLDIASHSGLLASVTGQQVVASRLVDHRIGDHALVPLIEDILHEAEWSYRDLTHLACVVGPGGFTSLRVGVSCINALSWALKIPSTGIHLSDLYAARVVVACRPFETVRPCLHAEVRSGTQACHGEGRIPQGDTLSFLWLHSTKRTELFVRGFGSFAQEWPGPILTTLDDLLRKLQQPNTYHLTPITYTGELLPEHHTLIEEVGGVMLFPCPVSDVLPQFLSFLTYQTQVFQPWYGRGW